jgi:hypothetical protein
LLYTNQFFNKQQQRRIKMTKEKVIYHITNYLFEWQDQEITDDLLLQYTTLLIDAFIDDNKGDK